MHRRGLQAGSQAAAAMVLFFTPRGKNVLYVGRDKFENEELIAHGLPCDVWFHVDNMSSAHVYLRLQRGQTIADISKEELEDAAQLTKANSILGHKASSVTVVYTPWANLRKTSDMEVPCYAALQPPPRSRAVLRLAKLVS
jgi:predicted ribosome quality control (RQC) complex YloA/Tae2 family protein